MPQGPPFTNAAIQLDSVATLTINGLTYEWIGDDQTHLVDGVYAIASNSVPVSSGAWVYNNPTGMVDVADYAAALGTADDSYILAALSYATKTAVPIFFPGGSYYLTHPLTIIFGIKGVGKNETVLYFTSEGSYPDGYAMRLGVTIAEKDADPALGMNNCLCEDFKILGFATVTATRSADPSTINCTVTGLRIDENSSGTDITAIAVGGFYKGIDWRSLGGSGDFYNVNSSGNWYNFYYTSNSGDVHFFGCGLEGTMFASVGFHADPTILYGGGLGGIIFIGCHFGFGPYGWYQEPGNTESLAQLLGVRVYNSGFEAVGNQAIHLYQNGIMHTESVEFQGVGHIWCDPTDAALVILGDSAHPVQDYALDTIDNGNGITFVGNDKLSIGTSGYAIKANALQSCVMDLSQVQITSGSVLSFSDAVRGNFPTASMNQNAGNGQSGTTQTIGGTSYYIIGDFSIPQRMDGANIAEFTWDVSVAGLVATERQALNVFINGVNLGYNPVEVTFPAGDSDVHVHCFFPPGRFDQSLSPAPGQLYIQIGLPGLSSSVPAAFVTQARGLLRLRQEVIMNWAGTVTATL